MITPFSTRSKRKKINENNQSNKEEPRPRSLNNTKNQRIKEGASVPIETKQEGKGSIHEYINQRDHRLPVVIDRKHSRGHH